MGHGTNVKRHQESSPSAFAMATTALITKHSDFQFAYKTGDKLSSPQRLLKDCHKFELNATRIAWLTTGGVSQSLWNIPR
jgi:hypothetical protein